MSRKLECFEQSEQPKPAAVVLHVDDDPNDLELLRAAARKTGAPIRITAATNHEEAIGYLKRLSSTGGKEEHPSVILLDINLPKAAGPDLLHWIHGHPELKKIPVVVLSGSESYHDMQKAYAAGAASYHVKPLKFQNLVDLVSHIHAKWCNPPISPSLA